MAHPLLPSRTPRRLALLGVAGALLLPASPALGLTGSGVGDTVGDSFVTAPGDTALGDTALGHTVTTVCDAPVDQLPEPICPDEPAPEAPSEDGPQDTPVVEESTQMMEETLAPVIQQAPEPVSDIATAVADVLAPEEDGEPTPSGTSVTPEDQSATSTNGSEDAPAPPAGVTGPRRGEVAAAGTTPEEIFEPGSTATTPLADTGKDLTASAPTIQPAGVKVSGSNMANLSSQTAAPLVSTPQVSPPVDYQAPLVADTPMAGTEPFSFLTDSVVSFAGQAVLPYTSGSLGWITVAGLTLAAGAAYTLRRRLDGSHDLVVVTDI